MMLADNESTSDFEGFGISVLEGNIYGLPTIGSKHTGLEDSINNNYNGTLVNPNNKKEIVESLKKIFDNYYQYANFSKAHAKKIIGEIVYCNMKNLYKNKKLICTIISDTPYAKNKNGDLVGLGPTVEEIDQLSSLFCQIYHFAPLEKREPPLSFNKHNKNNITLIPMIPSGGKYIFSKLKHVFLFPLHLLRLNPILKKTEIIHFRAPSGFGVLFLPWLYVFWKKKIWIKYAGSWSTNTAPITYKFQRWLLLRFPKNAVITINNTTKHLANNFYQFKNPCFEEILIKTNKPLVQKKKKKFNEDLNLVFVGRVEENKGVDELFKVFHKIGNMENINSLKVIGESKKKRFYEEKPGCPLQKF